MPLPIVANAVALVAALAWLASLTLPATQAVRVRNAFLLRRGGEDDFRWTPDAVPEGFAAETALPPAELAQAVRDANIASIADEWTRALALAGLLVGHAREDAPIRADLATTWRGIVAGGGYCADYVRVYLAATRAAGSVCTAVVVLLRRLRGTWPYGRRGVAAWSSPLGLPRRAQQRLRGGPGGG